jgi:sulfur relay (sulfurtransferase) complex TusBCD TusD component (DsrE family)
MHYTIIVKGKTFRFETMAQAIEIAGAIFKETGVIVGIEAVAS